MGELFLTFLALLWLTYRLGKEDGNWGCFTVLIAFVVIALFVGEINS